MSSPDQIERETGQMDLERLGPYELIRNLGRGGMAEIFLARAPATAPNFQLRVAIKRIHPHLVRDDPQFVEMFSQEARLVAQLSHPNIVQVLEFGETDGDFYIVMEYVDGVDLHAFRYRARKSGIRVPDALCARIVALTCEGLDWAHKLTDPKTGKSLGLVHRDISPDNILLSRSGAVKVTDFGIAKASSQRFRTRAGVLKGKLTYMAPERIRTNVLDRRADVYSLGVVLYELLCGKLPYEAETELDMIRALAVEQPIPIIQRRPDLPAALQKILTRSLAKEPADRYPSCREMQADLERFIQSSGTPVGTLQISQLVAELAGAPLPEPPPMTRAAPISEVTENPGGDNSGAWQSPSDIGAQPGNETRILRKGEAPSEALNVASGAGARTAGDEELLRAGPPALKETRYEQPLEALDEESDASPTTTTQMHDPSLTRLVTAFVRRGTERAPAPIWALLLLLVGGLVVGALLLRRPGPAAIPEPPAASAPAPKPAPAKRAPAPPAPSNNKRR